VADFAHQPLTGLKGAGPRLAARLGRLGLHTVQDLLFHLPLRYEDRTRGAALGELRPGESATILAQVDLAEITRGRRPSLLARVSDGTGSLTLRFFNFAPARQRQLTRGRWVRCFGNARPGRAGLEMVHPDCEVFDEPPPPAPAVLTPVYPATEGVHQITLRRLVDQAVARLAGDLPEDLPGSTRDALGLPTLAAAVQLVHRPPEGVDLAALDRGLHPAQRRLAFEELVAHHLSLRAARRRDAERAARSLDSAGTLAQQFIEGLPFALTGAQQRALAEIRADLAGTHPMHRLLQGDVGAGKTVVAAAAALLAVEAGVQVAVMAPTEVLASQLARNFERWLTPLGVRAVLLSAALPAAARRRILQEVASGEAVVCVGTHALFQTAVQFACLGLVIVDEQHRFGVHQRLALREKGADEARYPHQLVMTATPIPRTLAMTAYADLDLSVLDEIPPGRTPVETVAVPQSRREEVLERIRHACSEGRQAYWVCPAIDESDAVELQAAIETARTLGEALAPLRVELLHGRMRAAEKAEVMKRFTGAQIDILVATTVIEVGVDVPNASLMIIENAERMGLAQLHQLRGRVGRGSQRSSCVLLYRAPLSQHARARLATMRETTDGFEIARRDLELRGPGELLGTRQTGLLSLRVADLVRDQDLLALVEPAARWLMEQRPERVTPLIERWIGDGVRYADA